MKRDLIFLTTMLLLLSAPVAPGQEVAWIARYDGPVNESDEGYDLAIDNSGNVYVTGYSQGSDPLWDYVTIKYDATGAEQWVARYNGPGNAGDIGIAVVVDGSGNVYVTGYSEGSGTSSDYATIKYDAGGNEQWVARYNGPGNSSDEAYDIEVDNSGNVYVTGYSTGSGTSSDYATIKYDVFGNEQWVARYNGPANLADKSVHLGLDGSGNVYVTGYSQGPGSSYDYATIKYDASGNEQWVARYNGPGNSSDFGISLVLDELSNVYVTGQSEGPGTSYDYATIKYDESGIEQWVARYNGSGNYDDLAYSLAMDGSGNLLVTGASGAWPNYDYATVKYDASGQQLWAARYNGPGNLYDYAYVLAVDDLGNVYVSGSAWGSGTATDYTTIKYDGAGAEQWVAQYNGPGNAFDDVSALAVDDLGNVYVTGQSFATNISSDIATIKYRQGSSAVSVGLTLDPARGDGAFDYAMEFTNNTDSSVTADIWTEMTGPGERSKIGPVVYDKTFEANRTYSETSSASLGEGAPLGDYVFTVSVGDYPDIVIASASAPYTKVPAEPAVEFSPSSMQFVLVPGQTDSMEMTITNAGGGTLTFSLTDEIVESRRKDALRSRGGDAPWLNENPTNGSISSGGSATIQIAASSAGLANGGYNAVVIVSSNDPNHPDTTMSVNLTVTTAGPEPLMSLTHTPGDLNMGVFNDGSIGADNQNFIGPGVSWRGSNGCFVGGPIFGTSATGSVNGLIGSLLVSGDIVNVASNFVGGFTSNTDFDQIASADLDDSGAPTPYGLTLLQRSYTNTGEEYGFIRYGFIHTSGQLLADLYSGIFLDWDVNEFVTNSGGYDLARDMVYNWDAEGTTYYYGLAALDGLSGARTTIDSPAPTTRTGSFTWITTFDFTIPPNGDFRTWIGTGPMDVAPGDTTWTTFAVLAGDDLTGLQANADAARAKAIAVGWVPASKTTEAQALRAEVPESFHLGQNYPNPFNPTTMIRYDLPTDAHVSLKVYDVLGREILTLVDRDETAGQHQVVLNASGLSSGVYFYRLRAGGFTDTRRFLLLR
jgi:hypothetical protein